ncbi:MAG: hypothetical protein CMJ84_00600, partial [Planctomycetes bacterium]|nr:hypothetical protein [Planctomycetota bacterium]
SGGGRRAAGVSGEYSAAARAVHERAVRLEESQGRRSATTAHVIGGALLGQERYAEAVEPILDGIALAPRFHGLRSNLGIAYRRIGALDEAERHLLKAIEIRPTDLNPYLTLIQVHLHGEEFDDAQAWLERAPFGLGARHERMRLALEGEVLYGRAVVALEAGDDAAARDAADEALRRFDRAVELGGAADRAEPIVCRAILDDDVGRVFAELAGQLRREPSNWARLETVISMMPADLSASESEALRAYLIALARHLAPAARNGYLTTEATDED